MCAPENPRILNNSLLDPIKLVSIYNFCGNTSNNFSNTINSPTQTLNCTSYLNSNNFFSVRRNEENSKEAKAEIANKTVISTIIYKSQPRTPIKATQANEVLKEKKEQNVI